jgi:hypothetical protein
MFWLVLVTVLCHYFNFIHISTYLYMFRAHRPILRRIHTAVHTTIVPVAVPFRPRALYVVAGHQDQPQHTEHAARTVQPLNQWLCEQLCEFS